MSTRYSVAFFPCSDSSHHLRSPKGECPSLGRFFLCPGKSLRLGQGADMHHADTPVFSPDDDDSTLDSNSAQLLRPSEWLVGCEMMDRASVCVCEEEDDEDRVSR